MKNKRNIYLILGSVACIVVGTCVFALINRVDVNDSNAIVNVSVNPSVEFVVDSRNRVVSVKGLNDEGMMMVYGERIIGKNINDAVKTLIKVETKTGYLVVNGEASINKITLSVGAENESKVNNLQLSIENSIIEECKSLNVNSEIEKVEKYTKDNLISLAMKYDSSLTFEKANMMSYKELAKVIAVYHIETSDIYEEKLEDYYRQIKDSKIELSQYECLKKAIESASDLQKIALDAYKGVIQQIETYYNKLDEIIYTTFVDSESEYQKALKNVNDSKNDVLLYRQKIASSDPSNKEVYDGLISYLSIAESVLETNLSTLHAIEETGCFIINNKKSILQEVINSLSKTEQFLTNDIKEYLNKSLDNLDKEVNNVKANAFKEFEKAHKDDIEFAKINIKERKEKLIKEINNA